MAFASSDASAAQDAAPRIFTGCPHCHRKGRYQATRLIGSVHYTYERCRYCGNERLVAERPEVRS